MQKPAANAVGPQGHLPDCGLFPLPASTRQAAVENPFDSFFDSAPNQNGKPLGSYLAVIELVVSVLCSRLTEVLTSKHASSEIASSNCQGDDLELLLTTFRPVAHDGDMTSLRVPRNERAVVSAENASCPTSNGKIPESCGCRACREFICHEILLLS